MIKNELHVVKAQLADSSRKLADLTANMVYENPSLLKPLLEIAWYEAEPLSQRASRVVSICSGNYPEMIIPYVSEVIQKLSIQKSEGSRRNFLKIFADGNFKIKSKEKGLLMNSCFGFLTGNYSVAVKVYSMEILYKLSVDLPEIQRELYEVLNNQKEESSAGYKSRAQKILKRINQNLRRQRSKNSPDH